MIEVRRPHVFLSSLAIVFLLVSIPNAAIPAGYIGKPYPPGSAPHEIPGRVNFHDYDSVPPSLGNSQGVLFCRTICPVSAGSNAGGKDAKLRHTRDSDKTWPAFWFTNDNIYDLDTFYADGVNGPTECDIQRRRYHGCRLLHRRQPCKQHDEVHHTCSHSRKILDQLNLDRRRASNDFSHQLHERNQYGQHANYNAESS